MTKVLEDGPLPNFFFVEQRKSHTLMFLGVFVMFRARGKPLTLTKALNVMYLE